jgi:hypothetical protein
MRNKIGEMERITARAFSRLYVQDGSKSAITFRAELEDALRKVNRSDGFGYMSALHDAKDKDFIHDIKCIMDGKIFKSQCMPGWSFNF